MFCEEKLSNVKKPSSFACLAPSFGHEQNRLRPFIKQRRSCRQDLNRKRYQPLFISCTKTAQNSQFSHNSESLVRSALHFSMGSPATRQGHEKLVYRLIHLFSSTEIFSKRRKICSCWRKTKAGNCNNSYYLSPVTCLSFHHFILSVLWRHLIPKLVDWIWAFSGTLAWLLF